MNESKSMAGRNRKISVYLHIRILTSNALDTETTSMLEYCSVSNPVEFLGWIPDCF